MKRRLFLLAIVALGLAPGTWLRSAQVSHTQAFTFTATAMTVEEWSSGGFALKRAWRLNSPHPEFGGFSALLYLGDDQFLAGSDKGYLFRFDLDAKGPAGGSFNRIGPQSARSKTVVDLESLMLNPDTGQFWGGFERSNTIVRYSHDQHEQVRARPQQMRGWSDNSGPEAMTMLADGRVIVIAEQRSGLADGGHEGLLYPGDPTQGQKAVRFAYPGEDGHRPTDMAAAPNGKVVLVLRRFELLGDPSFTIALAVADPAKIRANKAWQSETVIALPSSFPLDNFEGLALDGSRSDSGLGANSTSCRVWLLSDDNVSALQDTILLEFEWDQCGGLAETPQTAELDTEKPDTEKGAQTALHAP